MGLYLQFEDSSGQKFSQPVSGSNLLIHLPKEQATLSVQTGGHLPSITMKGKIILIDNFQKQIVKLNMRKVLY